jgi:L-threonylcarbamoyladenylate synthase
VLRNGGVIAYPTDTLYGLGANPSSEEAIERLLTVKGRSNSKGLPLLLDNIRTVETIVSEFSEIAQRISAHFWPGALTLILPAKSHLSKLITGNSRNVAVRVPNHPIPRALAAAIGGSIIGTSANLSNRSNLLNANQVSTIIGDRLEFVLDGGPIENDAPSTVLDLTGTRPSVVRIGVLSIREIEHTTSIKFE